MDAVQGQGSAAQGPAAQDPAAQTPGLANNNAPVGPNVPVQLHNNQPQHSQCPLVC